MMRWIIESRLTPRIVMAGLAVLLMIFGFTRLRHGPVSVQSRQAGGLAPLRPEFLRPRVEGQAEPLVLSAQEAEDLAATALEAGLLDDEVSYKEREMGQWVSSKSPDRNPVGRSQSGGEMLVAVQDLSSRAIPLRI